MKRVSGILAIGALLAVAPLGAEARPLHHHKHKAAQVAQPHNRALDSFAARMNRLDALMGIDRPARTRSASADH